MREREREREARYAYTPLLGGQGQVEGIDGRKLMPRLPMLSAAFATPIRDCESFEAFNLKVSDLRNSVAVLIGRGISVPAPPCDSMRKPSRCRVRSKWRPGQMRTAR